MMQSTADQAVAHDYAARLPEYGGMYHDGDALVVLFTAKLAEHDKALRALLAHPESLTVLPASRSWEQMLTAADLVRDRLSVRPDISSVGVTVADDAFTVTVGVDPYSKVAADAVRARCAPESVLVRDVGSIVRLPHRSRLDNVSI